MPALSTRDQINPTNINCRSLYVWLVQRQPVGEEVHPGAVVPVSGSGSSRPSVQLLPSATNRVVADGDRTSCFEIAMKTGRKALIPALIDSGRGGCGCCDRVGCRRCPS